MYTLKLLLYYVEDIDKNVVNMIMIRLKLKRRLKLECVKVENEGALYSDGKLRPKFSSKRNMGGV